MKVLSSGAGKDSLLADDAHGECNRENGLTEHGYNREALSIHSASALQCLPSQAQPPISHLSVRKFLFGDRLRCGRVCPVASNVCKKN